MCSLRRQFLLLAVLLCIVSLSCGRTGFLSCGRQKVKTAFLIHNGINAKAGLWPWHVAIYHGDEYKCGGSIIDGDTILTAAHCVQTEQGVISKTLISVQVGRVNLNKTGNHLQIHEVKKLLVHPGFNGSSIIHDIALIKVSTNITMNRYVQPVCLWTMDSEQDLLVGKNGTIVGFGFNERDVVSDQLKQALIEVVDPFSCIQTDRDVFGTHLTWDMFCGLGKANVSACNGDSGGGMFFEFRGKWFVRGLVSYTSVRGNRTLKLCDPGKPTVYTDVAKYLDWIKQYIDERILPYESDVFDIDYQEKLRLFNFDSCGAETSTYTANATIWELPWIGIIRNRLNEFSCTITLINEWYAVGPANCIKNVEDEVSIILGGMSHYPNETCFSNYGKTLCSHPTQELQIKNIIKHYQFNRTTLAHNIALIELMTPADTTQPNVRPICMAVTSQLRTNATTNLTAAISQRDVWVANIPVRLVESNECEKELAWEGIYMKVANDKLCWRAQNIGHLTLCDSDMLGNPLQERKRFNGEERYFLRGFNPFRSSCADFGPAVYLNAEPYLDWILYNMRFLTIETTTASGTSTVNQTLESEWNMLQQQPGKEKLRLFNMDTCGITSAVIQPKEHVPWIGFLLKVSVPDDVFTAKAVLISDWYALAPKRIVRYHNDWRYLLLGKYENNTKDELTYQLVEIKNFIIAPPDQPRQRYVLIELLEPADSKIPYIRPICLPFMERFYQLNQTEMLFSIADDYYAIKSTNISKLDELICQNRSSLTGVFFPIENHSCAIDLEELAIEDVTWDSPFQMRVQFRGRMRYFLHGMYGYGRVVAKMANIGVYLFESIELAELEWILENMQKKERQTTFLSSTRNERVNLRPMPVSRSKRNIFNFSKCGLSSSSNPTPWIGTYLYRPEFNNTFDAYYRHTVTLINEWYAIGPAHTFEGFVEGANEDNIIVFGYPCYEFEETKSEEAKIVESCISPTQRLRIKEILIYPHFNGTNDFNNIALYRLATPVNTSSPNVKPICLPIRKKIRSYDTSSLAMVSSNSFFSGVTPEHENFIPETYNVTNVEDRYVDLVECQKRWKQTLLNITVDSSNHCLMNKRTSDDKCVHIPPGASLHSRQMLKSSERSFLRGVVFDETQYCSFFYPTVFINTDAFLHWILETMEPSAGPSLDRR